MCNPRNNLNIGPSQVPTSLPKQMIQRTPFRDPPLNDGRPSDDVTDAVFNGFSCESSKNCQIIQLPERFETRNECIQACEDRYNADGAQYISAQPGANGVFYTSRYHQRCSCFIDKQDNSLYNDTAQNSQQLFSIKKQ